ncbi:MAG: hypothetical protein Fur0023_06030 [Bacteroidia bacterium]
MNSRKNDILEMLKEHPNDVFLNYALGLELVSENQLEQAIQQFQKTIALDENYVPAYYQYGLILYENQNKDKALEILSKGLTIATQKKLYKEIAEFKSLITNIENDLL